VISPWRSPLPLEESTMQEMVVYFYSGSWIPIMFCRLAEAIALHQKACREGKELFVFPPDVDPRDPSQFTPPHPSASTRVLVEPKGVRI
jgi:hypothetical protein